MEQKNLILTRLVEFIESKGGSSYFVQVRVTVNGQRENIKSLGIEVQKKDWDYAKQRIKGNGPDARANNLKIANVEADLNNLVFKSYHFGIET